MQANRQRQEEERSALRRLLACEIRPLLVYDIKNNITTVAALDTAQHG